MKTLRALSYSLIVLFFFPAGINAAGKSDFSLSIEPIASIRYGIIGEHLYAQDTDGEYKQISYLEWEEKPLFLAGAKLDGSWKKLSVSLYAQAGIPSRTGSMYDSDWLELTSVKNNYSISENTVSACYGAGISAGWNFIPAAWVSLAPTLSADYEYISFEARNGHGWYGGSSWSKNHTDVSWDSEYAQYYGTGSLCGVDYRRYSLYTWIGCNAQFTPSDRWQIATGICISPYSYTLSYDTHYGTLENSDDSDENDYYADLEDIILFSRIKGTVSGSFFFTPKFALTASCTGIIGWPVQGKTYTYSSSQGEYLQVSNEKSGASVYTAEISLGFKILFF